MTKVLLTALTSLFVLQSIAQITLQRVDKQYELGVYELAIPGYLEVLQSDPQNRDAMIHLAHSYRMINEDFEAVKWFSKAQASGEMDAEDLLAYGHSLKVLGRYQDAKAIYRKVNGDLSYAGSHFFLSSDRAVLLQDDPSGESLPLVCNSKTQDFAPEIYKDRLYFSSFRKDIPWHDQVAKKLANLAESSSHFVIDLSELEEGAQPRTPGVSKAFPQHSSPYSIAEDANMVVFAKNNYREGTLQIRPEESGVGLYFATITDDGSWHDIKAFEHNKSTYSNNYPYLSEDGKTLYFSSNKPGGYGAYDLYQSTWEEEGWSEPVNLGPIVNTEGSEITPFFVDDQLYFSSDWHFGLGGFDVFVTSQSENEWVHPDNMGAGFNSSSHDYSPVKLDRNHFLLVSNRTGGYGMEDIFIFSRKGEDRKWAQLSESSQSSTQNRELVQSKPLIDESVREAPTQTGEEFQSMVLIVQDHSGARIANALVDMADCGSEKERTDTEGRLLLGLDNNCEIIITASGYLKAVVQLDKSSLDENNTRNVVLIRDDQNRAPDIARQASKSEVPASRESKASAADNKKPSASISGNEYWTVQIAALSQVDGKLNKYANLRSYGHVHSRMEKGVYKILVGQYTSKEAAQKTLETIKNQGYRDAFVTRKINNGQPAVGSKEANTPSRDANGINLGVSPYKVRLAAYEDLKWFDVDKVEDLGKVEHWNSGDYAIMVLAGFADQEAASKALDLAISRGFKDAKLVYEENGMLRYVKK